MGLKWLVVQVGGEKKPTEAKKQGMAALRCRVSSATAANKMNNGSVGFRCAGVRAVWHVL